ncbi:MAG: GNAT family N-acetyltransferase [Pseudomonadota bacterium]
MLQLASSTDSERLLDFIQAYHQFEKIQSERETLKKVLAPLLVPDNQLGRAWLVVHGAQPVGYLIIAFGYSIESGGRDAIVDEFFIDEDHRGLGLGYNVFAQLKTVVQPLDIKALYLEVAQDNVTAQRLYEKVGFIKRNKYFLMNLDMQ